MNDDSQSVNALAAKPISLRRWITPASLLLNLVLAAWLLWPAQKDNVPVSDASTARIGRHKSVPPQSQAATGTEGPAFHWSRVESDDYRKYIANLRAVGCPEQVVRDIIITDLSHLYSGKKRQILSGGKEREYWQKDNGDIETTRRIQIERFELLIKEREALVQELLNYQFHEADFVSMLFLQLDSAILKLAFLPQDVQARARQALVDAGLTEFNAGSGANQRLEVLATILSADQLEEYRLRVSDRADQLHAELMYFDCSREEYQHLLKIKESNASYQNVLPIQQAEAIRAYLGEERFAEFQRSRDWTYQHAHEAVRRYGLDSEAADQIFRIKETVNITVSQIRADTNLSAEERQQQLRALKQETDARIVQVMGEKGARYMRRYDPWLAIELTNPNFR